MKANRFVLTIMCIAVATMACSFAGEILADPSAMAGHYTMDLPAFDNHANLRFLTDQASASESGAKPVHGCWPSDYYDDGYGYLFFTDKPYQGAYDLQGSCRWTSPSDVNPQVTWNNIGKLTGAYDQRTGVLTFHLETTAEYPYSMTVKVIFDGTGYFTSPTHAEGTALWHSICSSLGDENHCGTPPGSQEATRKSWDISGTVPWTMDFTLAPDE